MYSYNPTQYATSTVDLWRNLILEASTACNITLPDELESYLVFLLLRFTQSPELAGKLMAIELLESIQKQGRTKIQSLRDVGDSCLLYAGLFPEHARKRRLKVSYYVKIGQSAYHSIANTSISTKHDTELYITLCDQFVPLMDILHSTRELGNRPPSLDPLLAAEIWEDTDSIHARNILQKLNNNSILVHSSFSNHCKH